MCWWKDDATRRPIDAIIANLNEIHQSLTLLATNPSQAALANAALQTQVSNLRSNANRMPAPFSDLMLKAAGTFEGDLTNSSHAQLTRALGDQVTGSCQQIVPNDIRSRAAARRKSRWRTSAKLFGPGGIIDRFFTQHLTALVDTSRPRMELAAGQRHAEEVVRVMDAGKIDPTKQTSSEVRIWGGSKTVTCPGRTRTNTGREGGSRTY